MEENLAQKVIFDLDDTKRYYLCFRIALWIVLCSLIFVTRVAVGACFVSVVVLLNDSVDNSMAGTVNGLSSFAISLSW